MVNLGMCWQPGAIAKLTGTTTGGFCEAQARRLLRKGDGLTGSVGTDAAALLDLNGIDAGLLAEASQCLRN